MSGFPLVFLWYDLFAFWGVVLFLGRTCGFDGFVLFLWLTRVCVCVFSVRYDLQGFGASLWYEDDIGI